MPVLSFDEMRRAMVVSQLRPEGVTDARVLDAMGKVPRENYVPDERRATAYADRLIPIDGGRGINPPIVTGRLLNEAQLDDDDQVLIIGSASGYLAAVVSMLTKSVTLADAGAAIDGCYDAIIIDGAVERIPDDLATHLTPDGRLVAGIVDGGVTRLAIGRRSGTGFALIPFMDAEMIVLPEFARPTAFVF